MPQPQLERLAIEDVSKVYGDHVALRDFSLDVAGGEFVALLGPSGCGKSTMLNCLAGLVPLTSGRISIDGDRIDPLPPERRRFGMVFQNYALFPHLNIGRNVAFGLESRRVARSEIRARVARALGQVRLEGLADRYPSQLSGGQQQRVAMARAIVLEPRLILMDEPLSNLDAQLRTELRTELRRLHQDLGLTTIYVTHDQSEALSLADRLVVMRNGVHLQIGTPATVYTEPADAFVAAFMGYRNLIPARRRSARDGDVIVELADGVTMRGVDRGASTDEQVVVAVRPSDFTVVPAAGSDDEATGENAITCTVRVVEYQGEESAVEAEAAGGLRVHFRTTERVATGERVAVHVDPSRLLVFAADA
ncbi:MAG: ABC transporter ATP-binding protein [Chloroflexi bacterium]|nr:ABC transporter ATP-binding protein [Chloroflexota bacterium]MBA3779901.1 ABC transporter ATP-binding protein [Chloroflexota bacterium]